MTPQQYWDSLTYRERGEYILDSTWEDFDEDDPLAVEARLADAMVCAWRDTEQGFAEYKRARYERYRAETREERESLFGYDPKR